MLGFMGVTAFLSMWISNTATTAMMVPIVQAVLEQLNNELDMPQILSSELVQPSETESKQPVQTRKQSDGQGKQFIVVWLIKKRFYFILILRFLCRNCALFKTSNKTLNTNNPPSSTTQEWYKAQSSHKTTDNLIATVAISFFFLNENT